jgi:hypothetical protein
MGKNPDVDAWFAEKRPVSAAAMQRMREVILDADPRMQEQVQYGTINFGFGGVMASVVQVKEPRVNLMFHRGAAMKGEFPHLEGEGRSPRYLRFADVAEVEAQADEIRALVRAWCELVAAEGGRKP